MSTYTIVLERISTGEVAPSMVVRKATESEARSYAEAAIEGQLDIRIHSIVARAGTRRSRTDAAAAR